MEHSTLERSTVERSTPDPARMHVLITAPPLHLPSQVGLHPGPGNGSRTGRRDHPSLTGVGADGSAGGGNIRHAGVTTRATGTTQTTALRDQASRFSMAQRRTVLRPENEMERVSLCRSRGFYRCGVLSALCGGQSCSTSAFLPFALSCER